MRPRGNVQGLRREEGGVVNPQPCWTCDECGYTQTTRPRVWDQACPEYGTFGGKCQGTLREAVLPSRWTRLPSGRLVSLPEDPPKPA